MGDKSRQLHKSVKVRVHEKDHAAFAEAAAVTGQTVSSWARAALLERAAEMRAKGVIA